MSISLPNDLSTRTVFLKPNEDDRKIFYFCSHCKGILSEKEMLEILSQDSHIEITHHLGYVFSAKIDDHVFKFEDLAVIRLLCNDHSGPTKDEFTPVLPRILTEQQHTLF